MKTAAPVCLLSLAADDGRIFFFLKKIFLNIAQFGCGLILKVVILKFRLAVHVVDHYAKSWPGSRDLARALAACKKNSKQRSFGIRREMNMAKTQRHYWPLACFLSHTNMANGGTSHHWSSKIRWSKYLNLKEDLTHRHLDNIKSEAAWREEQIIFFYGTCSDDIVTSQAEKKKSHLL